MLFLIKVHLIKMLICVTHVIRGLVGIITLGCYPNLFSKIRIHLVMHLTKMYKDAYEFTWVKRRKRKLNRQEKFYKAICKKKCDNQD